jgi:hypothetical protein
MTPRQANLRVTLTSTNDSSATSACASPSTASTLQLHRLLLSQTPTLSQPLNYTSSSILHQLNMRHLLQSSAPGTNVTGYISYTAEASAQQLAQLSFDANSTCPTLNGVIVVTRLEAGTGGNTSGVVRGSEVGCCGAVCKDRIIQVETKHRGREWRGGERLRFIFNLLAPRVSL